MSTLPNLTSRPADEVPAKAPELRAVDCKTPADWARWARERREYEDPYGYQPGALLMRPFTLDDQIGGFLDALLKRRAHRPEPLTVATVMGAANLADELARRAVEGEQVEEHHPIERAA